MQQHHTQTMGLWLTWPNLVRKLPRQLQLGNHLIMTNIIPITMARKPTLRADTQPTQRLLMTFPGPFTYQLRCLFYLLLHLPYILQLRELTRDQPQDHIFTLRQLFQRFESSSTRCVVFEVICPRESEYDTSRVGGFKGKYSTFKLRKSLVAMAS
jgi:hypothetical protein